MLEWLKRHAWKACIRQKRIASSNLAHSAKKIAESQISTFSDFFSGRFQFSKLVATEYVSCINFVHHVVKAGIIAVCKD